MGLFVSERGNKGLRFNNYTYRLVEVNKKSKRFRCTKKDCPANLLTDCDEQNIVKIGKPHNHEAPPTHAKEMQTARAKMGEAHGEKSHPLSLETDLTRRSHNPFKGPISSTTLETLSHIINSSYFIIIILLLIIINMSGKIVIIIITTTIIIITNGYLSINISSHTEKKKTNIATGSMTL
ncbi:hypothetical protein ElyMa_000858100 [Elysia marginata]|uniref:FLYWCH-type domain-containing protein n=1 Tax=Elysia marginata TaxID=1093978 RepID=A0AAV4H1V3_9GAST|nr:hypothetical protein ElyMa_000858100 [Elysia marginata]